MAVSIYVYSTEDNNIIIITTVKYNFFFSVPLCKYTILSILSTFDTNPWMTLIAFLPSALLGNSCLLATICYISDTTVPEKRSWRLACLQTSLRVGLLIGTFIGPLIFQELGYTFLFIIAASLSLLSLLYVLFMVPESIQNEPTVSLVNN